MKQLTLLFMASLWGLGTLPNLHAEDDHAGHDHAGHAEEDDHAIEDDHAGHADDEDGIRLTPEQRERFGIVIRTAGPGNLGSEISLPGEVVFNEDRVVHIVPRVAGISQAVLKSVGDRIQQGEILAVIESRELADAKSVYLAAQAREALARITFTKEKNLYEKQVSSEQDFLKAEQVLAEARIDLRSAQQKLHALGLPPAELAGLEIESDEAITRYEIRSPISGVVTEKHIATGESLAADTGIFTVVDLSSVWVNLVVYTKNLGAVRPGQEVVLRVDHSGARAVGQVSMVTPFADESTRSATARVVLDNSSGQWIPGTFVTGYINSSEANLPVVVPQSAVQKIEGTDVVFVQHEGRFEMNPVILGRMDRINVEVLTGLQPGTPYVAEGAFQLKATVITSTLGSHAGHGH